MTASAKYLTNGHVMADYPEGFCIYERSQSLWDVARNEKGLVLTLKAQKPALVMNAEYANPFKSFTKRAYQSVHNGSATDDLRLEILTAYNADLNSFRQNLRTVGCGSNVYFDCKDGLFQACVQRTAPVKTQDGVVQPGAFSRAAGGATGHLQETQIRELTEEMNVFIRGTDGSITSVDLMRTGVPVSEKKQTEFHEQKAAKLEEIFGQIAAKVYTPLPSITRKIFNAHEVHVDGLHEYVEEDICGLRHKFRAVVADDAKNGDLNGVDCLLVVPMKNYHTSQIFIADGERNQQGQLLGRTWFLAKPEFLASNNAAGTMKFSPVLAKTLQATPDILKEISRLNI